MVIKVINTWRTINSILGKSKTSCNSVFIHGELNSKSQLLANHFNNHFTTVADKLLHTLPTDVSDYCIYLNTASAHLHICLANLSFRNC